MSKFSAAILTMLLCFFINMESYSCSVMTTYFRPTNYDLVKYADSIVLAEATKISDESVEHWGIQINGVEFEVLEIIKGEYDKLTISIPGSFSNYRGPGSDTDFSKARPGAYYGSCIAMDYKQGNRYLLFLLKNQGWRICTYPFSRVNEEITDDNSPWMIAVREYNRISQLDAPQQEKNELTSLLSRMSESETTQTLGLRKDLKFILSSPSEFFPFEHNHQIFLNSPELRTRQWALDAISHFPDDVALPVFEKLVNSEDYPDFELIILNYAKTKNYASRLKFIKPTKE